jgi:hypothetical protein
MSHTHTHTHSHTHTHTHTLTHTHSHTLTHTVHLDRSAALGQLLPLLCLEGGPMRSMSGGSLSFCLCASTHHGWAL